MEKIFNTLYAIDLSDKKSVLQKGATSLTYISWSDALASLMKIYPESTYGVVEYDGKPYLYDENLGYMVRTWLEINGIRREMWLPVMNSNNQAMLSHPYTKTYKKYGKDAKESTVTIEAATMFDINTTIMRCLVKNMAAFGLGLYIYTGDDIPEPVTIAEENKEKLRIQKELQKLDTNLEAMADYYEVDNILLLPLATLRKVLALKQAQGMKKKEASTSSPSATDGYIAANHMSSKQAEQAEDW